MPPANYYAFGESLQNKQQTNEQSRSVEIIIYTKPETVIPDEAPEPPDNTTYCHYVDYVLQHRANIRTVMQKGKKYVRIETIFLDPYNEKKHYYATRKNGQITYTKVKWRFIPVGRSWWGKGKHVALIPKEAYDQFKIFVRKPGPCDECAETFEEGKLKHMDTCMQTDRFLMRNMQVKFSFFNRNIIHIRAPREYVDPTAKYYVTCYEKRIRWRTKGGRSNKNYYFTTLPVGMFFVENIMRRMNCCNAKPEASDCDVPIIPIQCMSMQDKSPTLGIEAGAHYTNNEAVPYAALAFWKNTNRQTINILTGIDKNISFYGTLRLQHYVYIYPLGRLKSVAGWQSPSAVKPPNLLGAFYLGTETRAIINKTNVVEQNLHAGYTIINNHGKKPFNKLFIQAALAYNFVKGGSTIYPVYNIGLQIRLFSLKTGTVSGGNDRM